MTDLLEADPGCDDGWCCTHETWHDDVTDEFGSADSSGRDNTEPSPTGANPGADHSAKPLVLPSEMQSKIAEEHPHG